MTGDEIHGVLTQRGIRHLHHANSVMTSNSQILIRALVSRGAVVANQLPQTGQYTDVDFHAKLTPLFHPKLTPLIAV